MTVFLIGMISIGLFYTVYRIRVHQEANYFISNAIMHIEINASIYHLRLEEFVAGDVNSDVASALSGMDQAVRLADLVHSGGEVSGRRLELELARELGLQTRAQELKTLLLRFREIGTAWLKVSKETRFGSPIDQLFDATFNEILRKSAVMEDICKKKMEEDLRKSQRIVFSIYFVWALVIISATMELWSIEIRRKAAEESLLQANRQLHSQAEELAVHRENLAGLVEQRTAELTAANEQLRIGIAERRQAVESLKESEKQIRHLSSQLLRAQEIERKRISMELHDGLGQALNVMKLRIRLIENELSEEQGVACDDCENLLEYLDKVIDDVRRLSRDMSPAILENLGLTSALRWLVSDFRRIQAVNVASEIAEIDDLFSAHHSITIYRVVQEALTNVGKHSLAGNVSVSVRRHDDMVNFSVEDDGKGFDPEDASRKDVPEKGLGLTTMSERVRMMGGAFDLWSRIGKGTRITFSVPVRNGGS
jgi:signal transduction histidine kinase